MNNTQSYGNRKALTLSKNDIHLWVTKPQNLKNSDLLLRYKGLLTEAETTKQQRYRFEKDQHDALITRAFIRDLLSHYADIRPEDWRFEKGEKDKPEIINAPIPLRFNLSHTDELIICAVTLHEDIGCDVENMTRNNDILSIADRYFSATETQELFSLPEDIQRDRFFDYWTLKESYIKAWGLGLSIPLGDFSFNIGQPTLNSDGKPLRNDDISLSFAPNRIDYPEIWRNWLFYPSSKHRVALSIRSRSDNRHRPYKLRFFESTPLMNVKEVNW